MITLCGFALSNYYNKVKMVLLEKGVPFVEERVKTGSKDESVLSCSPLGKVPFIRTEHGAMCESQAIVDYIEATHPNPPLVPADPWQAAKVRELVTFIDLHIELVTRELYPKAFFGGEVSESNAARTRKLLERNLAAFKRLAATISQTLKYGTPLGQGLRSLAAEMRNERMIQFEERAGKLPALLVLGLLIYFAYGRRQSRLHEHKPIS